jgi:tRNA dimethylallyltransferase
MSQTPHPLLVITGPTGVGKTALAMHLADQFPLSLISADSVMVYRGLDIGSAKPSRDELARYPHALVDLVEPDHAYDAGQFVAGAKDAIALALSRGQVPCLVGGTILYLKALLDGLDALPGADPEVRRRIRAQAESEGWPSVHAYLRLLDPDAGAMIHPNHSSRIERALEVMLITGQSICSYWTGEQQALVVQEAAMQVSVLTLLPDDRDRLKTRLDQRFDAMLTHGLIEEVAELRTRPNLTRDCPSMRSVGYRQVWQHLDQELDMDQMRSAAQAATRQLAKRQLTWLRSWRAESAMQLSVGEDVPIPEATQWARRACNDVL